MSAGSHGLKTGKFLLNIPNAANLAGYSARHFRRII
jgi:hypothetical protein